MYYECDLDLKTNGDKIKGLGSKNSRDRLMMQLEHIDLPIIKQQIEIMNKPYEEKKAGRPAYHRGMVLVLALFFKSKHIHSYDKMAIECKDNVVLLEFTGEKTPGADVFRRFFRDTDKMLFKKIFFGGLARLNDYEFLSFDRVFLDGTDAIVNASLNNTINKKQIEALRLLKEWRLLHNGKPAAIKQTIKNLEEKKEEYSNDAETLKLIKIALRKPRIYTHKNFEKIPQFLEAMEKNDTDSVPISFPESRIMKSKRGRMDAALNYQILMLEKHIALSGYLLGDANDSDAIRKVFVELNEDLELFVEIIKEFGEYTDNIDEIENLLKDIQIFCDSGYHSFKNIKASIDLGLILIFMTKQIARQNNKSKRKDLREILSEVKNNKEIDFTKKDCLRLENAYKCPFNRLIQLNKIRLLNNKNNKDHTLPPELLEYEFTHSCVDCSDCPYVETYGKKCKCATIIDKTTPYEYFLTNSFVTGEYDSDYKDRFPIGERVNAFIKGIEGMLYLTGRDLQGVENEQLLILSIQNFTIFKGLLASEQ